MNLEVSPELVSCFTYCFTTLTCVLGYFVYKLAYRNMEQRAEEKRLNNVSLFVRENDSLIRSSGNALFDLLNGYRYDYFSGGFYTTLCNSVCSLFSTFCRTFSSISNTPALTCGTTCCLPRDSSRRPSFHAPTPDYQSYLNTERVRNVPSFKPQTLDTDYTEAYTKYIQPVLAGLVGFATPYITSYLMNYLGLSGSSSSSEEAKNQADIDKLVNDWCRRTSSTEPVNIRPRQIAADHRPRGTCATPAFDAAFSRAVGETPVTCTTEPRSSPVTRTTEPSLSPRSTSPAGVTVDPTTSKVTIDLTDFMKRFTDSTANNSPLQMSSLFDMAKQISDQIKQSTATESASEAVNDTLNQTLNNIMDVCLTTCDTSNDDNRGTARVSDMSDSDGCDGLRAEDVTVQ